MVRNGNDYDRIADYINDNPINWKYDDLYISHNDV